MAENEENKTAESLTIAAPDGPEVEPVDVVLTAEELKAAGAEAPEPEVEEKPEVKEPAPKELKKGTRADNRVAAATQRAAAAETRAETLAEENARLKKEAQEARAGRQVADHAALDHFEARTKAEVEAAERELEDAHKGTDPAAIAKATVKVSKAAANMAQIDAFRAANPKPDPKAAPKAEPERRQPEPKPEAEQFDEATTKWIRANEDWFIKDPAMNLEARAFANKLERQMKAEGREGEIATKEYFEAIEKHMHAEFPDYFGTEGEPEPEKKPTRTTPKMTPGKPGVAPVRQAAQAPEPAAGALKISLSAEDRKLAHSLADNGAVVGPNGERLTHAQAEKRFALTKLQQQKAS